jgi:hypothetical protein
MQALCRSYLNGLPELKNYKDPQQKKTKTFFAAIKIFTYIAVPLPIVALVILAICKKFSKKPPADASATTARALSVAAQTFPSQTSSTSTTTTTTTSTQTAQTTSTPQTPPPPLFPNATQLPPPLNLTTPNPNSVPRPKQQTIQPSVQVSQTAAPTEVEKQRKEILETAEKARTQQKTLIFTLKDGVSINVLKARNTLKLQGTVELDSIYFTYPNRDNSKPITHISGEDAEQFIVSIPLDKIKFVQIKAD